MSYSKTVQLFGLSALDKIDLPTGGAIWFPQMRYLRQAYGRARRYAKRQADDERL